MTEEQPYPLSEYALDQWWADELRKIFVAPIGDPITADMKRAANIALGIAHAALSQPASPAPEAMTTAVAEAIRKDALEIFDGPECSQDVRDAIEWYHSTLMNLNPSPPAAPNEGLSQADRV